VGKPDVGNQFLCPVRFRLAHIFPSLRQNYRCGSFGLRVFVPDIGHAPCLEQFQKPKILYPEINKMLLRREFLIVLFLITGLLAATYVEVKPVKQLMDWRATRNTLSENEVALSDYQLFDHTNGKEEELTLDFFKGKHFWHPQVAIWLEDSSGKYVETLLVTTSTARGLFYSGRSASTFRETDRIKAEENTPTRRVDALPYWSHKRGHRYADGFFSPPPTEPLIDAITGATPKDNFYFTSSPSSLQNLTTFKIVVEVNVAFDENEFYSEYDFLEDSLYHGGTGLLGQPSLIYSATIRNTDPSRYYILTLDGHGHHSGTTGELFQDTQSITTAKYIVERIVAGVNEDWYKSK
jgi:hypothetical protein